MSRRTNVIGLTKKKRGYELVAKSIRSIELRPRGDETRLIEDDGDQGGMDGYVRVARSFHGSGGKEILRSIGLPRKTKVGRVRSKSWTTHGRRIIGRCESVGVRKRLEKTRTVHLRLKTIGLYSQVGDRSRGMRDVEVDRLAVGRKEIIHINIDTHVISFKRIFFGHRWRDNAILTCP